MLTDFMGNELYIVFNGCLGEGKPACRVLGPFHSVTVSSQAIWSWRNDGSEPLRQATKHKQTTFWEIDGMDDEEWSDARVISPTRPTTCAEIEAANDWIRPRGQP